MAWGLRDMAHLGFLTFIRSCNLNPLFICLAKHFPAPFLVSSLSIMLCYVCMCPKPQPPFSAPFPLPIQPPQANAPAPSTFPGSVLVSTAFQSGMSCPSTVCTAGVQDGPSSCLPGAELAHRQLGVTVMAEVLCLGYCTACTAVFSE